MGWAIREQVSVCAFSADPLFSSQKVTWGKECLLFAPVIQEFRKVTCIPEVLSYGTLGEKNPIADGRCTFLGRNCLIFVASKLIFVILWHQKLILWHKVNFVASKLIFVAKVNLWHQS
ncbi:hypothetical protein CEXT_644501 [Caerostris extrusa]|uniref:Uncharacterized protein n=1 Tax=Caerostris extrusa TaxID=172846 RepID=A0AAV4WK10_CAEEX|nr:hypothetical protein CEXT_644501 [Caerostris extrusa]